MRVDSPLGKDVLLLRSFEGTESVSTPFSFSLDLLATRSVKAEELLRQPLTITVSRPDEGKERVIHGLVRTFSIHGRDGEFYAYRAEIVPWIWFLSLFRDCRVYQQMTALDIVKDVFDRRGYSDFRVDTTASFPTRDFTVQYRETDLDFVSRLLESEGIFYFFEHSKDAHQLVLADHQGALQVSPIQSDVELRPSASAPGAEGVIESLKVEASVRTGASSLDDYNYEKSTADLSTEVTGEGDGQIYDYPGGYLESSDGGRLAEIRLEVEEAQASILGGVGNTIGLIPGYRFNLKEAEDHDDDYLVIEVSHRSGENDYRSDEGKDPDYSNRFRAIPYATPYRPSRSSPIPVVHGAQTAVVVGPSGEEIYTDNYGRVKVLFHWDRVNPPDGNSSCWIRVASTWAGNKWGAIQIPRIGQEVVVEFLEGDPDRPIITGSVYNDQQMPPWEATPTQSGWKSHSSKGGAAESNEFRFEDKVDSEEIYIRGQKDWVVEIVNDHTETVGNDQTLTVTHDQTETVENDQTVTVQNNQTVEVEKNQDIKVNSGNRTIEVGGGNLETKVAAGKITYEAAQSIEFKVGGSTIQMDPGSITLKSPTIKVEGQGQVEITAPQTKVEGKAMVEVKGAMAKLEGQGMAEVKAAMVQVNGSGMLAAKGGITMIG